MISKMSKKISVLYRINYKDDEVEYISLDAKTCVSIGRDVVNDITLSRSKFISRQHVRLVKESDQWSVIDLNSSNGVFVNSQKITPAIPLALHDRDLLELGKDPISGQAHYTFKFYQAAYIRTKEEVGEKELKPTDAVSTKNCAALPLKRIRDALNSPSVATLRRQMAERERVLREEAATREQALEAQRLEMEAKQRQMELKLAEMAALLEQQQSSQEQLQLQMQSSLQEMQTKEQLLAKEKEEAENRIRIIEEHMTTHVQKSQEELQAQQEQKQRLLEELNQQQEEREKLAKAQQEQKEARQQLEEAVSTMMTELAEKREKQNELSLHVSELQLHQRTLESELEQEKHRLEEKLQRELAMSEELQQEKSKMDSIEEAMEEELVCTICSELFVKAMSLGCSHSFCHHCIVSWLIQKRECPNCRAPVTSCVPCIVLDNTISRLVQQLSAETKERRAQMLQDRQGEHVSLEEKLKKQPPGVRNEIERILNQRVTVNTNTAPTYARVVGTADNPIVLTNNPSTNIRGTTYNTLLGYLSPIQTASNGRVVHQHGARSTTNQPQQRNQANTQQQHNAHSTVNHPQQRVQANAQQQYAANQSHQRVQANAQQQSRNPFSLLLNAVGLVANNEGAQGAHHFSAQNAVPAQMMQGAHLLHHGGHRPTGRQVYRGQNSGNRNRRNNQNW